MSARFLTLVQREIWEHRGGLIYTPFIVGAVMIGLFLLTGGSTFYWKSTIDGSGNMAEGALKMAETQLNPAQMQLIAQAALWSTALVWQMVMFIVVFFYCLGSLYDDRRDRSVLFWKSMPVSDLETVLSKVATAVVVAPLAMLAGVIVGQIVLILLGGILVAMHGGNPWKLVWSHLNPFVIWAQFAIVQGVQALYLLPLFGWLMLASAFARGRPFLWAVLPPVMLSIAESWLRFTTDFAFSKVIWEFIVRRFAAGFAPVSINADFGDTNVNAGLSGTKYAANFDDVLARVASLDLWVGVAIGIAFLAGAIYLRRYRDDSTS